MCSSATGIYFSGPFSFLQKCQYFTQNTTDSLQASAILMLKLFITSNPWAQSSEISEYITYLYNLYDCIMIHLGAEGEG